MSLSRRLARPLLATTFAVGAVEALRSARDLAPQAAPVADRVVPLARRAVPLPDDPETLVRLTAGVQLAASLALATGRTPRLAAGVLAVTLVPASLTTHPFWSSTGNQRRSDLRAAAVDASLLGGLLIAAGDTDGRPGVAWRARRAGKDARREARHLRRVARQEARIVKANLG